MSRQYAPLHTEIWNDPTFVGLSSQAQRLYLLAISQPNITWCGVVPYTARRWSNLASDTTPRTITKAAVDLAAVGLVLLDEATEEMWVRSFIKYNVVQQPKLRIAAIREFAQVHSQAIQDAAAIHYPWLVSGNGHGGGHPDGHPDGHSQESENLRVGVDVQGQVQEENPSTENTNTNTANDAYRAEARRQANLWLIRDPNSIIDVERWIAKRAATLADEYPDGLPVTERPALRLVCVNPDCREGHDLSGPVPVPCTTCNPAEAIA